jgi:plasmid maintenance system killer protein
MELSFRTAKLRKELSDAKAMDRAYGADRGRALRMRLSVLRAAACLRDVPHSPPDRCHQLTADRAGQVAVVVKDQWRLIFVPDHDPVPRLPDGGLDEAAVTRIQCIEIVDYHPGRRA